MKPKGVQLILYALSFSKKMINRKCGVFSMGLTLKRHEILAPAGDTECLLSALRFGADAVYLAGQEFGMRTAPKNFDNEGLRNAVSLAHAQGVKVYLTCNTLPSNEEILRLPEFLAFVQDAGVDALIIADMGVLTLAKKYAPRVQIHISTQAGIVNFESANAFYNMGASRVVLARELTIEDIAGIRAKAPKELEIECFVHGAMCVSFSGRCLISAYLTGRDANRGDCAQPCRWKYHLYEESRPGQYFPVEENSGGTYLYNSRDLCMIEHIPELVKAGVTSFKIEGRAKSAYYTAVVTNAYCKALDDYYENCGREHYKVPQWIADEVHKISHREYSAGFFFGSEPGQTVKNGGYIREYEVAAVCEGTAGGKALITQRNRFFCGDTFDVLPPSGVPFETKLLTLSDEYGNPAESAPHPMQRLLAQTEREIPAGSYLRKRRSL